MAALVSGLLASTSLAARAEICAQRALARSLRAAMRSEEALRVLQDLPTPETPTSAAAVRLDRAAVLLDIWNMPQARVEIAAASQDLARASASETSPCGASESEESIQVLELGARASRLESDYSRATEEWKTALARRRAQANVQPGRLAESLSLAADAFWLPGGLDEMERLYAEATDLAESLDPPDDLLLARIVMGTGLMAAERGEVALAEAAYGRSLEIYRRAGGDSHPALAGLWLSIGALAGNRYDLLTADDAYQHAATILEPLTDLSLTSDKATLSFNLGLMDARLGRIDDARAKLDTAHRLWTVTGGSDHSHLAWVNESLSDLLADAGRLEDADSALALAVRQRERSMPDSPIAVLTAARLATLRAREDRTTEARSLWRGIDASVARLKDPGGFFRANLIARRADTAEALGDLAAAMALREEVEGLLDRQLPKGHPGFAEVRGQRARLAWLRGRRREALGFATSAWQLQRQVLAETIPNLPESDALRFVERSRDLRDLLLCAAANTSSPTSGDVDQLMRELAESRALISGALSSQQRLAVPAASNGDTNALARAQRRYAALLWQPVGAATAEYGDTLKSARHALEDLERKVARRGPPLTQHGSHAATDAWASLAPGDVLVAFGRYRCPSPATGSATASTGYVAFVRTATKPARIVRFSDGAALDRAVAGWYKAISASVYGPPTEAQDDEVEARGRAIVDLLWDPLVEAIGTAQRVFIVPDGALHTINWYALPGSRLPYLIDEPRILHVLTAESDLRAPPSAMRSDAGAVVALADPLVARASTAIDDAVVGTDMRRLRSACRFLDPRRLPRLDHAVNEAHEVERQAHASGRPFEMATGAAATESWLREHAQGASILHLAAHGGLLSPESCREPTGVAGADGERRVLALWSEAVRARPLMRSGLLLTGAAGYTPIDAPGTDDDGVLVAEEAARLDLRGADWVVLSACSTRRGPVVDAEGALGLHRAFHSAGARTVIASLWDVQDAPARRFMTALYDARLRRKRSTADAMRDAQRAVLNELRVSGRSTHPVQWAAFVASGDWR